MSNLEFAAELAKRSASVLGDESKAQAVLDEFEGLDPREAQIVYRAFTTIPGSVEQTHAQARISALVASGKISKDLASLAAQDEIVAEEVPAAGNDQEDYYYSRIGADAELSLPQNVIMDPTGKIGRMIMIGLPKDRILEELSSNVIYQSRLEIANSDIDENDFDSLLTLFQFNELNEALEGMLDPAQAPDIKATAKEKLSKYDEDGSIGELIDSGMKSVDIFNALDSSDSWLEAYKDYATRDDVQIPRYEQLNGWYEFREIVNSVKDLDLL